MGNVPEQKKIRECTHVQHFLRQYRPELAHLVRLDINQERPDFIIGDLGIEHTEYLEQRLRGRINIKKRITSYVERRLSDSGYSGLLGSLIFRTELKIRKEECEDVGEEIFQFLSSRLNKHEIRIDVTFHTLPLSRYLFHAMLFVFEKHKGVHFDSGEAAFMPRIEPARISEIVNQKNKLWNGFTKCKDNWLVIVADGFDESRVYDFDNIQLPMNIESPFSHIFLFDNIMLRYLVVK